MTKLQDLLLNLLDKWDNIVHIVHYLMLEMLLVYLKNWHNLHMAKNLL